MAENRLCFFYCYTGLVTDFRKVKLSLSVQYPDGYPDVIPELTLESLEGELEESEASSLLDGMRAVVCLHFTYDLLDQRFSCVIVV